VARAKDAALTRLPARLRERLFRGFGAVLPGLVESRARFAGIDMPQTRVFSDELNYFPALHYNLRGREPAGTVEPADIPALRSELEQALYALRDPYNQAPVVARVHAREELFHGPCLARAPDLLLELALDAGYSYNLMPSTSAAVGSLAGSHRDRGLYVACGPSVRALGQIDAAMADVSATLLARMQVQSPADLDGRILSDVLNTRLLPDSPEQPGLPQASLHATAPGTDSNLETGRVEERLRRLGYIE
jgi:predicted AlkP superfamily phosphohydrolase/phosphomutase